MEKSKYNFRKKEFEKVKGMNDTYTLEISNERTNKSIKSLVITEPEFNYIKDILTERAIQIKTKPPKITYKDIKDLRLPNVNIFKVTDIYHKAFRKCNQKIHLAGIYDNHSRKAINKFSGCYKTALENPNHYTILVEIKDTRIINELYLKELIEPAEGIELPPDNDTPPEGYELD